MENSHYLTQEGAVFTHEETNALDASIMEGRQRKAGAGWRSDIKNPISAARRVMTNSPHVMLAGRGPSICQRTRVRNCRPFILLHRKTL